jgi:hypothetical protein
VGAVVNRFILLGFLLLMSITILGNAPVLPFIDPGQHRNVRKLGTLSGFRPTRLARLLYSRIAPQVIAVQRLSN